MGKLLLGTSGWSYDDWRDVFYPPSTPKGGYLSHYATRLPIVEVDSTYYRIPSDRMVAGWHAKTPDDFRFTVKTPSVITHEKVLADCEAETDAFLSALAHLGNKLHSVLLQFGYFNKRTFATAKPFFDRLDAFLSQLPDPTRIAVEIRNKSWLCDDFFDLLRSHGTAFALTEHAWMPRLEQLLEQFDCVTGSFAYVRLIGDRKGIEEITTSWDRVVVDRQERIAQIARALSGIMPEKDVVTFINNHFAGHAPASCQDFLDAMERLQSQQRN